MKKIYLLLLLPLLLSGCTLFEEDYDQVPHHTGEGYDKPVTETVSGVEMTYQFNDNVRLLDEKEQQQIAYVEADETNLFMQVDFKDDTPENLLPKKGEILVSKVSSLFPYGASHHVRSVKRVDGKYRCLLEYAKLDETFKELDIDGQLTYDDVNQDEYYVATRAGSSEEYVEEGFSFSGSTVSFKLPIPFGYSGTKDGAYWSIDMKAEKNYVKVSTEFNFDKFSIRNGNYNIDVVETEEQMLTIDISGGFEKSGTFKKWRPVKNKTVKLGYVVLVFFIDIDIQYSAKIGGTASISYSKTTVTTHHINLIDRDAYWKEVEVKKKGFDLGAYIEGSFIITPKVTFGIGLYTKTFTIRLEPYMEFGIEAKIGVATNAKESAEKNIENCPSIEFVARIGIQVRFVADFSFEALLGPAFDNALGLAELIGLVDDEDFYKEVNTEADYMAENEDDSHEHAYTIGPWTWNLFDLVKPGLFKWNYPLYPKMDDKSFRIITSHGQNPGELKFNAEFRLSDNGLLCAVNPFYPSIRIMKGKEVVKTVSNNMGIIPTLSHKHTFTFSLTGLEPGVSYTAVPCYRENSMLAQPTVFDKGLPFSTTKPAISITKVDKGEVTIDPVTFEYVRTIVTTTRLVGSDNVESWGLIDMLLYESLPSDQRGKAMFYANATGDGQVTHKWTLRTTKDEAKIVLCPFAFLWKDTNHKEMGPLILFEPWEETFEMNEFDFSDY